MYRDGVARSWSRSKETGRAVAGVNPVSAVELLQAHLAGRELGEDTSLGASSSLAEAPDIRRRPAPDPRQNLSSSAERTQLREVPWTTPVNHCRSRSVTARLFAPGRSCGCASADGPTIATSRAGPRLRAAACVSRRQRAQSPARWSGQLRAVPREQGGWATTPGCRCPG
jgi:hypothetical protein